MHVPLPVTEPVKQKLDKMLNDRIKKRIFSQFSLNRYLLSAVAQKCTISMTNDLQMCPGQVHSLTMGSI